MELGEEAAPLQEATEQQICRLCGQTESIYIDIFGEEGTKRLLSSKIHNKINILIDEKDPLPKAICVQCLGKLEFVCDFQEECARTQQLLQDQYNLSALTDNTNQVDNKPVESGPSTSTQKSIAESVDNIEIHVNNADESNISNINNNNTDKNFNSVEQAKEEEVQTSKNNLSQRNLRSQQNVSKESKIKKNSKLEKSLSENDDNVTLIREPITKNIRRLRSRSTKSLSNESPQEKKKSILKNLDKKKLRSHGPEKSGNAPNKNTGNSKDENMIQIPTNTLNKVLTAIANSPGFGVSVKESTNRTGNAEDISFTVELSKKQDAESLTVLAKVFPDQGSSLVDKTIVTLIEDEENDEVNNLVNNMVHAKDTNNKGKDDLIEKLQNADDVDSTRNPEELFKMDGKEINVDEKVETVYINNILNYSCKLCKKVYERKDKCTVHVKTHLGIKQYMCILCQAKFVCKSDVMKHIRCSHTNPRPISCPKCPKRFRSKFDLTEHMNVHKGIKPYQCADCDQSYHHKVSLQMHVKSHMPPQNLACEYCGKVFPYRTRLLSHIGSVHMKDRRNFRCRFCYNLYSSLAVLNEHVRTRHTTTYTCETCNKTFKVASKYKAHVLQHSNPKPFACNICNNRYASKAFLNEHVLKHQGLRKHICSKCGAKFAQASHLAAHRHVHGDKTHACPECGKKFNRRDNMKVHRKRHLLASGKKSKQKKVTSDENDDINSNEN